MQEQKHQHNEERKALRGAESQMNIMRKGAASGVRATASQAYLGQAAQNQMKKKRPGSQTPCRRGVTANRNALQARRNTGNNKVTQ